MNERLKFVIVTVVLLLSEMVLVLYTDLGGTQKIVAAMIGAVLVGLLGAGLVSMVEKFTRGEFSITTVGIYYLLVGVVFLAAFWLVFFPQYPLHINAVFFLVPYMIGLLIWPIMHGYIKN
ncbi:MAG: hypothetical protein UU77_C0005G0002 [candidate division WWE3 bacterium GW2011_GWC1_41_7]|uniref:Uncharacterized protein n=3 Tax=Katanobacteria TaxID=422282 RepID=A0A0G0X894_UNCKA|nr:MAG: hypothetical protein UU72_C0001G0069 [candidate division WWE3 bacterium GW2011_GWB1_41_6]KKS21274.1 MAG: hypothetical protein UU77_C0005G0002 [candidate division WWE3 bacterium GW2011_GWC1_41_7]OGC57702.1 MAG: hypothetical protein A2976_02055 [candidate division WWE3 bacterium RIFCSPLOWO2_01_FULL_41_9]